MELGLCRGGEDLGRVGRGGNCYQNILNEKIFKLAKKAAEGDHYGKSQLVLIV